MENINTDAVGEKRNSPAPVSQSIISTRKKNRIKLPVDLVGIRPPTKAFILLPNTDVRYSYPVVFCEQINGGDIEIMKQVFGYNMCTENCTLIYEHDGEGTPHIDKHVEIHGIEKLITLWQSIFNLYPDYLITLLGVTVHHNPESGCAFITSTYRTSFTQIFEKVSVPITKETEVDYHVPNHLITSSIDFRLAPKEEVEASVEQMEEGEIPASQSSEDEDIFSYKNMLKEDSGDFIDHQNSGPSVANIDTIFKQEMMAPNAPSAPFFVDLDDAGGVRIGSIDPQMKNISRPDDIKRRISFTYNDDTANKSSSSKDNKGPALLQEPVKITHSGKIFFHLNSESRIEKIVYLFTFDHEAAK